MKNLSAKSAALVAVTVQLALGSTGALASGEQTLMNTSLPLPDVTAQQQATKLTSKRDVQSVSGVEGAKPVAMRFFGKDFGTPPAAKKTEATPPAELRPAIPMPEGAEAAAKEEQKLETNQSWSDPGPAATPAATPSAPQAVPAPKAEAPVEQTTETATQPAEATTELTGAASVAVPVETAADQPLKLSEPIKESTGLALLPTTTAKSTDVFQKGAIIIDNDELVEQQETIAYEELPLDEGKTKVKAGAHFPIVIASEITSRTAKVGDPVQGRLKFDLKIGDRLVAQKGALVRGHLNYALKARTPLHSMVSHERWYKNSGCLGITFDEIINEKGEHIPLVAEPAKSALYVKNKAEGRVLGINHKGQIAGPWSQQLQYKAVRVGMNFAMAPLGAMSFGAMPVALGVIGAINPSFAFMKPVGLNVRHRRIKGFFWGALSGVPGSWLIEDTTIKGQEAVIKPGDEFLAELRQEFTGEPATDAEMLGGDTNKVHGEVVGAKNNKLFSRKKKSSSKAQHPNM